MHMYMYMHIKLHIHVYELLTASMQVHVHRMITFMGKYMYMYTASRKVSVCNMEICNTVVNKDRLTTSPLEQVWSRSQPAEQTEM